MATYESRRYNTPVTDVTKIADGSVNNTEFETLDGVTSDIQTQLNAKLNLAGGALTGALSTNSNISLSDSNHIYVGTGQDIDIVSDGSAGYIRANDLRLTSSTDENYVTSAINGATNLWYDNSNKLQTTSSGVSVTGTMAATTLTGDGSALTSLNASNLSSGTVSAARLPGGLGKVLQVVSTNNGTVFSTSSSSYVDVSGQSVTITPSATSSKVLVTLDYTTDTFGDNTVYSVQLVRGSTAIGNAAHGNQMIHMNANEYDTGGFTFLDSPSTTSATTYKLQVRTGNHTGPNGGTIIFNRSQDSNTNNFWKSNITVQEIGS
tara:strand:- start:89 stop:1048 length:960 start_codon:yes stop_codon:yes gene_type:complete